MILGLYRVLTWLATPFFFLIGQFQPASSKSRWRDRLGTYEHRCDLWLHAASVGEISLLEPLVHLLLQKKPALRIQITAMTEAGVKCGKELYGERCVVSFAPYDLPAVVRRTLRTLQPKVVGFAETEIWPNLILGCAAQDIPTILINGRMSERAAKGYQLAATAVRRILNSHERLFIRSNADLARYQAFQLPSELLVLAGDLKFDAPVNRLSDATRQIARKQLGIGPCEFLIAAGSTRPGEEKQLLEAFLSARNENPALRLCLAPRHLERLDEVQRLIIECECTVFRIDAQVMNHGVGNKADSDSAIMLVTQMGLLRELYQLADLAFVGGTLVPIGGHNLLEPVWAGTPVLFGPHLENVTDAAEYILAHNFGGKIENSLELQTEILTSAQKPDRFARKHSEPLPDSASLRIADYIIGRMQ